MSATADMTFNIIANLLGRFAALALNLLFLPIFLRLFGAENFGLIVIATSIFFLIPVLDAGFGITLNKLTAQAMTKPNGLSEVAIALKAFQRVSGQVAVFLMVLAPFIGYFASIVWDIPNTISIDTILICVTVTIISAAVRLFCLSHIGVLMGAEKQVFLNIINTAGSLIKTVGTLIVSFFWPNIIAYFICLFLEAMLVAICTYKTAWRFVGYEHSAENKKNIISQYSTFFGFMAINTGLLTLLSQLDRLIASALLPLKTVGLYGVAAMLSSAAISISYPAAFAAMPRFAGMCALGQSEQIRKLHQNLQMATICVFGPACGIIYSYAKPLLTFYLGQEDAAGQVSIYLRILSAAIFAGSLMSTTYYLAVTSNRVRRLFIANVVVITLSTFIMFIASTLDGARGIALAVSMSFICHLILVLLVVQTELGLKNILKLLLIGFGVFLLSSFGADSLASLILLPIWCLPILSILATMGFAICIPETRNLMGLGLRRFGIMA
jgi:O-antigen/teichoic acid export membrane protein